MRSRAPGVYRLGRVRRGAVDDGGAAAVQDDAVQAVRVGRADDLRVRLALRPRAGGDGAQQRALARPGRALEYVNAQAAAQQAVKLGYKAVRPCSSPAKTERG